MKVPYPQYTCLTHKQYSVTTFELHPLMKQSNPISHRPNASPALRPDTNLPAVLSALSGLLHSRPVVPVVSGRTQRHLLGGVLADLTQSRRQCQRGGFRGGGAVVRFS